jgi:glycine C-acetyltransferase
MKILDKCIEFYKYVENVKSQGQYYYLREIQSASGPRVMVNNREMIMLASNNYLGLCGDHRLKEAAIKAIEKYGAGSGGTRILSGTQELHEELEHKLAAFKGLESVVVFNSGFMANFSAISTLVNKEDLLINDEKNHASIIDGCRFSGASTRYFKHNNMAKLEEILENSGRNLGRMIIVDGVFSMDGDLVNLPEVYRLAKKHDALLMIDEAHATGVIGPKGRGTPEHYKLLGKIDLESGTLSKSLGAVGGFVGGRKEVISYLKHNARSFVFTTSIPASAAAAAIAAIEIIEKEPQLREKLLKNVKMMKNGLNKMGFNVGTSESPIIPIIIKDEVKTFEMAGLLDESGVFVNPVIFPAVRKKESRIRISLMANHSIEDIEAALAAFKKAGEKLSLI